ncbi:hypothetical protein [Mycobacterium canetti]|uniref:hypothetical protein n=1 Tax=Mycobacterium canetti TaxID=78331 RepID=UPI001CD1FF27|nr:hypothetical protein [Mycobacterium canetti]
MARRFRSAARRGLTVVVAELIDELGWPMLCLMTIAAGALQIVFGLSRWRAPALAIAPVVVHAMLAASASPSRCSKFMFCSVVRRTARRGGTS